MLNDLCIRDVAAVIGGRLRYGALPPLGGELEPIARIIVDSQSARAGDLYWSLPGSAGEGLLAEQAFGAGALGAVVSGRSLEPWSGCFSIEVEDARWAMWKLAAWNRRRFGGRLISIAGTVGKTTARSMIDAVLSPSLLGTHDLRSEDPEQGALLALLDLDPDSDYALLEMSGQTPGDLQAAARLCEPQIAVLMSASPRPGQRYQFHYAGEQGVLDSLHDDGWAVLNGDDPYLRRIAEKTDACVVWVGRNSDNDLVAEHVTSGGGKLSFVVDGQTFELNVWGRHHLNAALSAIAVGRLMGQSDDQIAAALRGYATTPVGCQIIDNGKWVIIDDSGSSNVAAMQAAMQLLREMRGGRRIVLCGDLEDDPTQAERFGAEIITHCGADQLAAWGAQAETLVAAARQAGMPQSQSGVYDSTAAAAEHLKATLGNGDVVLVKGRRTTGLLEVVKSLAAVEPPPAPRPPLIMPSLLEPFEVSPSGSILREIDPTLPPG
ncbi:Mur ligase family protein [Lignipirellula cremea]|uniref:UDP-N-acetylmuramoyl-tripeptide--D-alanyl-D-alanine ligase MurF n=1 Tax=Lignipirellula cremea TaxID=2528010 RepID=A0A518DNP9_9BACT|nr:Mur ligase family protein [Lignipirellula cremea]QDU93433.1 UDP-N-acetylmuramoyl-tripeptide--D-alanyl-D-alanine ligase MurF [Lignipirellula cremea]